MKEIVAETGGRPFANDDLLVLQQELTAAATAAYLGKGAFIVSGCQVSGPATNATITAGIVMLDGQLLRYAGQSGATLPAQFQAGAAILSDARPYQTGGTKYCAREVPAVLVPSNPAYTGGEFLTFDVWGGKRWEHVQRAAVRSLNEVMWLASFSAADYDSSTGLGLPGTDAWGWKLLRDAAGRFPIVLDTNQADYDTVGKTGGAAAVALDTPHLPAHSHKISPVAKGGVNGSGAAPDLQGGSQQVTGAGTGTYTTEQTGGGQPHENRPPFYVLAARQWVGF